MQHNLPQPFNPARKFAAYAGSNETGWRHEHAIAFAASADEAEAAADCFRRMVTRQLDITKRLEVTVTLHAAYGAEICYKLLPSADVPVEWLQLFEAAE